MQLRDFLPKSLYARAVLIVILPIFLMQASVTYGFFVSHWRSVSGRLSESVAGDIAATTRLWTEARAIGQEAAIERIAFDTLHLSVKYKPGDTIPPTDKTSIYSLLNQTLEDALDDALDEDYWFNTRGYPAYVEIAVQLDGGYLNYIVLKDRVFATNGHLFFAWMVGSTLLLGWIAILFLRNQVRSIQRLAQAAEDFGRGRDAPDFRPSGATEVRRAGRAFIAMRERIKRHLHQRTALLAGVSHDLRTPLTRLKLSLEMLREDEEVAALKSDVAQMQGMLDSYLAFARDQAAEETEAVDL
ncbi:MAG: histidine kinase dimerization/phospho-acceptor domain-containing protein, partial [Pseudomonadota bacterium]